MTRRLIGAWTWIGTIASLAIIIFSGLSYFRVWGSRVVFSAIGEAIFLRRIIRIPVPLGTPPGRISEEGIWLDLTGTEWSGAVFLGLIEAAFLPFADRNAGALRGPGYFFRRFFSAAFFLAARANAA